MSKATQLGKLEEQARRINQQTFQIQALQRIITDTRLEAEAYFSSYREAQRNSDSLLKELYKVKPDHEIFSKNAALVESLKKSIEQEKKAE